MNANVQQSMDRLTSMAGSSLIEYREAILDELCVMSQSQISYVAAMDLSEEVLTMVGWSRNAMGECALIDKPIVYMLEETGLWGDAVRERKPVLTNDYPNLMKSTKKGYPKGHVHILRHMNLPIFENDHIVLVVGVGNKQNPYTLDDAYDIEEVMSAVWDSFRMSLWAATW